MPPQQQQQSRVRSLSYNTASEDKDDEEGKAFWDECDLVAKKNPAPSRGVTKTSGGGGGSGSGEKEDRGKRKGTDKEEVGSI